MMKEYLDYLYYNDLCEHSGEIKPFPFLKIFVFGGIIGLTCILFKNRYL